MSTNALTSYRTAKEVVQQGLARHFSSMERCDRAPGGERYTYTVPVDKTHASHSSLLLLRAAAQSIDPLADVEVLNVKVMEDDKEVNKPALHFSFSKFKGFPAYTLFEELSALKETIRKEILPSQEGLFRIDPVGELKKLDIPQFFYSMIHEHERKLDGHAHPIDQAPEYPHVSCMYRLPEGTRFTDAHGVDHAGLISLETMQAYLKEGGPSNGRMRPPIDHVLINDATRDILLGEMTNGRPAGQTLN